jgi:hypothetical protein
LRPDPLGDFIANKVLDDFQNKRLFIHSFPSCIFPADVLDTCREILSSRIGETRTGTLLKKHSGRRFALPQIPQLSGTHLPGD